MFFSPLSLYVAVSIAGCAHAGYTLEEDYLAGEHFFEKFTFWDAADPVSP